MANDLFIRIKNSQSISKQIKKFAKDLKLEIIKGFDHILDIAVEDLKADLKGLVNGEKDQVQINDKENKNIDIFISKSDAQILSELTNSNFNKLNTIKDYNSMIDSNVAIIVNKDLQKMKTGVLTTSPMSSGVNFRLNMEDYDTFDNQKARALDYFNNTTFAIEINGRMQYYLNPGIDLSQYVKIVCSTQVGDTPRSREVFDRHKTGIRPNGRSDSKRSVKSYADWTLLSSGIDIIKTKFIKLNPIVEEIKNRNYENANSLLTSSSPTNSKVDYAKEQIKNISDNKNITPSTKAYTNIIQLIDNLKIRKNINGKKTIYTLFTKSKDSLEDKEENFLTSIKTHIYLWKVSNENKLIGSIENSIRKAITNFNR